MPESPVLTSWKEIAAYLGKGVRTVQRWEEELRLPVRRPYGLDKHVVVALPEELDKWMHDRLRPRGDRPVDTHAARNTQIERMHRLLQIMHQRTEVLQKNMAILQKSAAQIAQRRDPLRRSRETLVPGQGGEPEKSRSRMTASSPEFKLIRSATHANQS